MLKPCFRAERDHGSGGGRSRRRLAEFLEAAGDFGLHFHHPQILFGEVVGEGNREIGEEPEGCLLEGFEPDEEIVSGALLLSFFGVHRGIEGRQAPVKGEAFPDGRPNIGLRTLLILWGASARVPLRVRGFRISPCPYVQEASRAGPRPRAPCRVLANRLKFAQETGRCRTRDRRFRGTRGAPMVVDQNAALQPRARPSRGSSAR